MCPVSSLLVCSLIEKVFWVARPEAEQGRNDNGGEVSQLDAQLDNEFKGRRGIVVTWVEVVEGKAQVDCGEEDPTRVDEVELPRDVELVPDVSDQVRGDNEDQEFEPVEDKVEPNVDVQDIFNNVLVPGPIKELRGVIVSALFSLIYRYYWKQVGQNQWQDSNQNCCC